MFAQCRNAALLFQKNGIETRQIVNYAPSQFADYREGPVRHGRHSHAAVRGRRRRLEVRAPQTGLPRAQRTRPSAAGVFVFQPYNNIYAMSMNGENKACNSVKIVLE